MLLQPNEMTLSTENRDYPEWHLGREHYALWYLEIQQPEVLAYLTYLRQHFSDLLLDVQPQANSFCRSSGKQAYQAQRQFHITLCICGFLTDQSQHNDDFSPQQFSQHLEALTQFASTKIQLRSLEIKSFNSALMIQIEDSTGILNTIRAELQQYHHAIAPLVYCPHITLGLYRDAFSCEYLAARIAAVRQHSFDLEFKQLIFGHYQAQQLQGLLYPDHIFHLDSLCCN